MKEKRFLRKQDILELIRNGENSGVEFKRDDIRPEQLPKAAVGMANAHGGRILLGVEDDGSVVGIHRPGLSEWIFDTVFGRYIHPLILPYYEEVAMDAHRRIGVISIGQEISKPYVLRLNDREEVYVRLGNTTRLASREHQARLYAMGGFIHAELMPVSGSSLASLDSARLENYLREVLNDPEIPRTEAGWKARLEGLGFMTPGPGGQLLCTVAGLVLFGTDPRRHLKQAGLRVMIFKGHDKEYQAVLDRLLNRPMVGRWKGTGDNKKLLEPGLIEECAQLLEAFILSESGSIDRHFRRTKRWLFPPEAVREVVVNALAHRDWTRFVEIEIVLYADRLEVMSPGGFQNSMTLEKMIAGQRSTRNQILVEVLRDYGYVDARGMGIRTKVIPLLKAGGLSPDFKTEDDYITIILPKNVGKRSPVLENVGKKTKKSRKRRVVSSEKPGKNVGIEGAVPPPLRKTARAVLDLIRGNPKVTLREIASRLGITERSAERNARTLQEAGFLVREGGRKEGRWKVTF